MKILDKSTLYEAGKYIIEHGRALEGLIYRHHFESPCSDQILADLKKYQNGNGGFGHALESDIGMPYSSPMASAVAFQHLVEYDAADKALELVAKGVSYFEKTYDPERKGWFAVTDKVNSYLHAPWWHFNEEKGMCAIDSHWGNPTVEITGYLYRYREYLELLNIDTLLDNAIEYLNNKRDFESFHEIYCYIRAYKLLPSEISARFKNKMTEAVRMLVSLDKEEWGSEYVAKPVDFVDTPNLMFLLDEKHIDENLDYLVDGIKDNKKVTPSWSRDFYPEGFEKAWDEWVGVLTLKSLLILDRFGRIAR